LAFCIRPIFGNGIVNALFERNYDNNFIHSQEKKSQNRYHSSGQ